MVVAEEAEQAGQPIGRRCRRLLESELELDRGIGEQFAMRFVERLRIRQRRRRQLRRWRRRRVETIDRLVA
jgi:hypothetical protein